MALEKSLTQSKKFIFALVGVLILAGLGVTAFLTQSVGVALTPVLLAVVIVIGFVVVGVVLGQAVLDKYVRVAEIVASKTKKEEKDDEEDPK